MSPNSRLPNDDALAVFQTPGESILSDNPLCFFPSAPLLHLRQVRDRLFGMFRRHDRMTCFPMLDGLF